MLSIEKGVLQSDKQRDGESGDIVKLTIEGVDLGYKDADGDPVSAPVLRYSAPAAPSAGSYLDPESSSDYTERQVIREALRVGSPLGLSTTELVRKTEIGSSRMTRTVIPRLVSAGFLVKTGAGPSTRYALNPQEEAPVEG